MWKVLLSPQTQITVVRHGQASYLEANYDKLSPLGQRQSRLLGEYWVRHGVRFDAIVSGPAQRHVGTEALVGEVYEKAGVSWPPATRLGAFDEFPGEAIVRTFAPVLAERYPHIRAMADAFEAAEDAAAKRGVIDDLFYEVARKWVANEVTSPDVESWRKFVGRISRGIFQLRPLTGGASRIAVFTSAGPTAVLSSLALGLTAEKTLDLAFSPRNASYSEFLLNGNDLVMSTFNTTPHLTEAELLTYR